MKGRFFEKHKNLDWGNNKIVKNTMTVAKDNEEKAKDLQTKKTLEGANISEAFIKSRKSLSQS